MVSRHGISPRPEFRVYFQIVRPTFVARDSVSTDRETGPFGPQDPKTTWFGAGRPEERPEIPRGLPAKKPKFPRNPFIADNRTKYPPMSLQVRVDASSSLAARHKYYDRQLGFPPCKNEYFSPATQNSDENRIILTPSYHTRMYKLPRKTSYT